MKKLCWINTLKHKTTGEISGSKPQKDCCGHTIQGEDLKENMKSKWHNISIKTESFEELRKIQRSIPIRTSIPQTIEWLIRVGQKQINQSETNDKTEL